MGDQIYRYRAQAAVVPLSTLSFILNSIVRFFVPATLPFIVASMRIDLFRGSLLITAYWIGYTAFQIPGGFLSDLYGTATINKISLFLLAALFALLYFSIEDYTAVFLIQLFMGSVSAVIYISDAALVQKWNAREKRSAALGVYQSGFFVGASFGEYFAISSYIVSKSLPFLILIPILLIAASMNALLMRDPELTDRKISISKKVVFPAVLRFSAGFAYIGFLAMFSSILSYKFHVPEDSIFLYSWVPAVLGIFSSPLGGFASARMKNGRLILAVFPVIAISIAMLVIIDVNFWPAILISSSLGFFYGIYAGPSMSMASDVSASDASISSSSSILNLSSQAGGMISPAIMGYAYSASDSFGTGILAICIVSTALALLSAFYLKRSGIT
ncbi:nitrate/nitrite transporter [Thermoplasma sp.]|uniref:MFS transporter n=1 Tax=Thermoplasma sp. TaxID=1973142 RepID=UPI00263A0E83|nr:MFS transporter [Thermoplasma sp.]